MLRLGGIVIKGGAGGSQSGFACARGQQVSGLSGVLAPANKETTSRGSICSWIAEVLGVRRCSMMHWQMIEHRRVCGRSASCSLDPSVLCLLVCLLVHKHILKKELSALLYLMCCALIIDRTKGFSITHIIPRFVKMGFAINRIEPCLYSTTGQGSTVSASYDEFKQHLLRFLLGSHTSCGSLYVWYHSPNLYTSLIIQQKQIMVWWECEQQNVWQCSGIECRWYPREPLTFG